MGFLIYLICLVAGLAFILIGSIAGHVFGGHDGHVGGSHGHAESGADGTDGSGVSAFSPTMIAMFLTAFGGLGVIFSQIKATSSPIISAPLSILGAIALAGVLLKLLRVLFKKTQASSESKVSSLLGQTASLITPIPENGVGEIAYVQAGTRYTAPARSEKGVAIANGQAVKITRVNGPQFFVEPV